jgi:hypothetical protein
MEGLYLDDKNNSEDNKFKFYSKENKLLGMLAIPYFGVYSPNYTFFQPLEIIHSPKLDDKIISTLPYGMRNNISELQESHVEWEYFSICLDGSYVNKKWGRQNTKQNTKFLRINFVPHPYIFYNVTNLSPQNEHKTFIYSMLYSHSYPNYFYQESLEADGLRFNREKFIHEDNKKEIILHSIENSPALSPNNCSFLINTNATFFSFYNMTAITYRNKIVKFMVGQFNVINYSNLNLLSPLIKILNSNKQNFSDYLENVILAKFVIVENFSKVFYYFIHKLNKLNKSENKDQSKILIKEMFQIIFTQNFDYLDYTSNKENNFGEFYFVDLCIFLWNLFNQPSMSNFGENIFTSHNLEIDETYSYYFKYYSEILFKYFRHLMNSIEEFFSPYFILREDYNIKIEKIKEKYQNIKGK